jgi:hypothetical protein
LSSLIFIGYGFYRTHQIIEKCIFAYMGAGLSVGEFRRPMFNAGSFTFRVHRIKELSHVL